MGCNCACRYQVNRPKQFFFAEKIGEYAYGFTADAEDEIGRDSLTVYGSTIFADAADFIRVFTQYTLDDYLFRLSCAQIQFMSTDNTHTKYLQGRDKKAWQNYKEAYDAQKKFETFMESISPKNKGKSGRHDIPINKKNNNHK